MKDAPRRIQPALQAELPHGPAAAVPLAEARNRLSALVDLVEQGEDVTISRRGVCVQAAVEKLLQLRDGLVLEGDLRAIAGEGLD